MTQIATIEEFTGFRGALHRAGQRVDLLVMAIALVRQGNQHLQARIQRLIGAIERQGFRPLIAALPAGHSGVFLADMLGDGSERPALPIQ